jgi:membrane-associated protein
MEYINYFWDIFIHLDRHLAELTTQYGVLVYAILFVIIFCETGLVVTPFLPGDSLLFAAGALSAIPENALNVHLMAPLLIVAAILGDAANYAIGQLFGKKLFSNPNSKIFRKKYLDQTHAFYEKHGGKTIILARFVPIVRTFAPFVAGMGRMTYRRFAAFNIVGGIVWAMLFTYAGYFLGTIDFVRENMGILAVVIIFVSLLPAIFEIWRNRRSQLKIKN